MKENFLHVGSENTQESGEEPNRFKDLQPRELIPEVLKNFEGTKGEVQIDIKNIADGSISYLITDSESITSEDIGTDFIYLDEEVVEDHPDIQISNDSYRRPLIYGTMDEISSKIAFEGLFEVHPLLRGKNVVPLFRENLTNVTRRLGFQFLTGYQNNIKIARSFLKNGMFFIEEVKDEKQGEFEDVRKREKDPLVFFTIKFLNPEDIETYIKPEKIHMPIDERIEQRKSGL